MSLNKLPKKRTMMIGTTLICLALVPLVHATVSKTAERQARFDEVANMTVSERNALEFQFEEFQKLTPNERQAFLDLHNQLDDPDNRHLRETLEQYEQFLRALNPVDRAEIDQQTTMQGKLIAIRKVVTKLDAERQKQLDMLRSGQDKMKSFAERIVNSDWLPDPLTPEEMESLSKIIEPTLLPAVKSEVGLSQQVGVPRFTLVMAGVIQAHAQSRPEDRRELFTPEAWESILNTLSEEKRDFFTRVQSEDQDKPVGELQRRFLYLTIKSLMVEGRKQTPSVDELQKYLQTMDPERKEKLMALSTDQFFRELTRVYWEDHPSEFSRAMGEFFKQKEHWDRVRRSMQPRTGSPNGRGPGGRRPGAFDRDDHDRSRPPRRDGDRPEPREDNDRAGLRRNGDFPNRVEGLRERFKERREAQENSRE